MQQQMKGKKILIATVAAEGHVNPITGLAKYLQELGCDVRWYTSSIYTEKFKKLDIPFYPYKRVLDVNSTNIDELFPERKLITDPLENMEFSMINGLVYRAPEYLEDIREIYESFPFDLMISDSLFPGIPLVKAVLNVPVVSIGIMALALESVDLAPYGMGLTPPANDAEREMYAGLREGTVNVMFKKSIATFEAILNEHGVKSEKSVISDLLIRQSDLCLQVGTQKFEYTRSDLPSHVHFVGALLPYSGNVSKTWFDERVNQYKKIILVTQGTVEFNTAKLLEPTLEAFKGSDTLVIVTTGGSGTAELRAKFSDDNFIIEDYIPFDIAMSYVQVFVSNGGYGGTLLAFKNNLPIVAAGVHEGKNEICSRIGYFNYGVNLNTELPLPAQIREAVEEVMSNSLYKDNVIRLAKELNTLNSNELCVKYIQQLLD